MERMMTSDDFQGLVKKSLFAPRDAARQLIDMKLARQWLWMALALMTVLNAIVYSVSLRLSPPQDPAATALVPPLFHSPFLFTIFLFGALAITVFTLHWIGQSMGGKAALGDILVLMTWMQVLRLILQVAVTVLMLVSPILAVLLIFVSSLWGIYILVSFIDTAHQFDNLFKAAGVIIFAVLAMAAGLTVILSTIGIAIMGGS